MTLGVLITNYQAWPATQRTLQAVLALHPDPAELTAIVVVDDASDAPQCCELDSRVRLHRNPSNVGYVRSVNIGMRWLDTDKVVILDCDSTPLTAFAAPVRRAFATHPRLGAVGFAQTDDSQAIRLSGEPVPSLTEFILGSALYSRLRRLRPTPPATSESNLCIHSCCMAVRRTAFDEVHGFDERFDFLDADMDFSWRLLEHAWENRFLPEVLCHHPGGGSPQSVGKRVLRHHQNRWRLLRFHDRLPHPRLTATALALRHSLESLLLGLMCLTPARCRAKVKLRVRIQLLRTVFAGYQPAAT